MHHMFDQDDLLLLAHIVCKSEVLNKDTSHSYMFDAYSQDTHDLLYPFIHMCVHALHSNYPLKDCTHLGGANLSHVSLKVFIISMHIFIWSFDCMLSSITKKGEIESTTCSLGGFDNSWQHTLSLGLIPLPSVFQIQVHGEKDWQKDIVEYPKMQGNRLAKLQARGLYILYLWEITLSP